LRNIVAATVTLFSLFIFCCCSGRALFGWVSNMPRFRCFFIDETDRVEGFETCESANQTEALARAHDLLRGYPSAAAVELWDQGQFVARVSRSFERQHT